MPIDLIIRNGNVVRPTGVEMLDLAIDAGKFVEIGRDLSLQAKETIDATDQLVFPGVIDSHVHFNEPGRSDWEGFETGSSALAAGGGTCFFDMPLNSSPPVLDGESFDRKLECAKTKSHTDFALWGGLTPNNIDKMEELADRGVVGFKAFMSNSGVVDFQHADDVTLWRGMEKAARLNLPVAVHAENDSITSTLARESINEGRVTARDYLQSRPTVAEVEAISRAVVFQKETGCRLHIVHISSIDGLAMGLGESPATCETCPHYLTLIDEDVIRVGAAAKCAPPIRGQFHRGELIRALRDGSIDIVASDHSPSPVSMKAGSSFFGIWGGIAGVQSTLPLLLMVEPNIRLERIAAVTSQNVSAIYNLQHKGNVLKGFDADFCLVNLERAIPLQSHHLLQRHKISPYIGMKIHGMIQRTILRGRTIFSDGRIIGPPGGKFIRPGRA